MSMSKSFILLILTFTISCQVYAGLNEKELNTIEDYLKKADSLNKDSVSLSIIYAKEAYKLSSEVGDYNNSIRALRLLSLSSQRIGQYNEAITYALEILKLGDATNDNGLIAYAYTEIGNCYRLLTKFKDALNFHQLAIEKYQTIGDSSMLASAYNDLGATYFENKYFDKALNSFNKSLQINQAMEDTSGLGTVYNSLGIIHSQIGNTIEAKRYFLLALTIFQRRDQLDNVARIENNLGKLYIKTGDYNIARQYIQKSYAYSSKNSLMQLLMNNYRVNVELYIKTNDYKQAFQNLENFIALHDSLKNESILKKVEQVRMVYEVDKMEKDLILARKENQLKAKNLRVTIFLSLGVFIIAILVVIVLIIRNRQASSKLLISKREKEITDLKVTKISDERKAAKEKYELELAFKNRELTTTTMHIVQKNELINDIRNHLSKMKLGSKANERIVNDIIQEIDHSVVLDKDWELFVKHFKDVHPKFFNNLLQEHPDLTSKEVRYCAYSRLNLSLKEISAVLNITTRGVEKARSRIRSKMGLTKEVDLNTYLLSLDR